MRAPTAIEQFNRHEGADKITLKEIFILVLLKIGDNLMLYLVIVNFKVTR